MKKGLFGRAMSAPGIFDPPSETPVPRSRPRRRGLFGGVRNYFTPDRLALIASAFESGGDGFAAERQRQQDAPYDRALRGFQMRGAKLDALDSDTERTDAANTRAARERYRARLPAEKQDEFEIDPEAYLTARRQAPEWETDDYGRPYTIQPGGQVRFGEGRVGVRQPGGSSGRTQYRPVSPEEARSFGLPGDGAGFAMGSNGRPIRVGGGGSFSPDQRARVEIGFGPASEAVQAMDRLETGGQSSGPRRSPINRHWGAAAVDAIPGADAVARNIGGADYQRYTSASSSFESGMLPILSGAAVTDSEARRLIRAALPQLGDGPDVLADKSRRRRQMLNGAAVIGGRDPPYPDLGVPDWAAGGGGDNGGEVPDGLDPEDWQYMTPEERALWQQ
jgi:hypothetical protein